ncbi:MAG: hypothetical protein KF850_39420 [Labilithrix sp.]|nr:hypothetical protein [Labilithrix sp.]
MAFAHARRSCLSVLVAAGVAALGAPVSCRVFEPSNTPIDACRRSCESKAKRQCNAAECERGCEFILDRLVEREGENVIACVASSPRRCTDVVWAECAAKVGVHADGGPPGPPPPPDDD